MKILTECNVFDIDKNRICGRLVTKYFKDSFTDLYGVEFPYVQGVCNKHYDAWKALETATEMTYNEIVVMLVLES